MPESDWEGSIRHGDFRAPGFVFVVDLRGLSKDQTARIRDQAASALDRYVPSERAIVIEAFRAIHQAANERIQRHDQSGGLFPTAGPNYYEVVIAADPTDPLSHIYDDRGTVIAVALKNAEDPDASVAQVWRTIAHGFNNLVLAHDPAQLVEDR